MANPAIDTAPARAAMRKLADDLTVPTNPADLREIDWASLIAQLAELMAMILPLFLDMLSRSTGTTDA